MALIFRPQTVPSRRSYVIPAEELQMSLTVSSLKPRMGGHVLVPQIPDPYPSRAQGRCLPSGNPILTPTGSLSLSQKTNFLDRPLSRKPSTLRRPVSAPLSHVYLQARSLAFSRAHLRPQSAQRIMCSYIQPFTLSDVSVSGNGIGNRATGGFWAVDHNEHGFETGDLGRVEDGDRNDYGVSESVSVTSKREPLTVFVPMADPAVEEDSESDLEPQLNSRQDGGQCSVPRLNLGLRPRCAPVPRNKNPTPTGRQDAQGRSTPHRFKLTRPRSSIKKVHRVSQHVTMDATNSTPRAPPPSPEKSAQEAPTPRRSRRSKGHGKRHASKTMNKESNFSSSSRQGTDTYYCNDGSKSVGRAESVYVFQNGEGSSDMTDGSSNVGLHQMDLPNCGDISVFVNGEVDVMDGSEEKRDGGKTIEMAGVEEPRSDMNGDIRTDENCDESDGVKTKSVSGRGTPTTAEQTETEVKGEDKTDRKTEFENGDKKTEEDDEKEDEDTPRAPRSTQRIDVRVRKRPVSAPPCAEEARQTPRPIVIPVATTYATPSPRSIPRPWSALPQKFDTGNLSLKYLSEANVLEKERGHRRVLNVRKITLDLMEPGEAPITRAAAYIRRNRTTHSWNMSQSFPSAGFLNHHMQMQHHHHGRSPSSLSPSPQTPSSSLSSPRVVKAKDPSKRPSSAYAYDGGFFTPCSAKRDWFVIHPDWVSDAVAVQKMNLTDRQDRPDGASERKSRGQSWPSRRCKSAPPPKRRNPITWAE